MNAAIPLRVPPVADPELIGGFLDASIGNAIHLVALLPDARKDVAAEAPHGMWFGDAANRAADWAVSENAAGRNVYWTVNVVRTGFPSKPKKTDIVAARFVHVDLDPPKDGRPFDRAGLISQLADMRVPPSFILDSGGGLQAFWRLEEAGANLPAIEALNKRASVQLGGDNCHNIDRLMRVPGTVNYPNALKRARGRNPALARVVEPDEGECVEIEALHTILPALPPEEAREARRASVHLSGIDPVALDALGLNKFDPLRDLIAANDVGGRSERTLKVAGILVRRGHEDAMIAGVLLNPDLPISGHCLDQANPSRAASRAIGAARAATGPQERHQASEGGGDTSRSGSRPGGPPPASSPGEPVDVSEDRIAQAFTDENRDRLKYDHDVGRWYAWDGRRWQREETELAFDYARRIARELGDGKKTVCRAAFASGVERFVQADRAHAVRNDVWDSDPFLLGTPSGTVDLRTGELDDAVPGSMITKLTGTAPLHGKPTLWLKFLSDSTGGDQEMIDFLQQWCGYCLTGDTREHALGFVYGPGGNGKSVFLNTIAGILGEYAVTSAMETFTASNHDRHSTELAMLRGARLVTASETEEGRSWAEARIKALTGSDPITARFMRQDFFTFRPEFKLMIAGNHAPTLKNVDDAMRRRFNIVPFTRKPVSPDRLLEQKLKAEWGQILAWAIRGCRAWLKDGLIRPAAVMAATEEYFEDQDVFGQWFTERCNETPGRWDAVKNFYADWATFAKDRGEEAGTAKAFGMAMKKRGYVSRTLRSGGFNGKVYEGVGLEYRDAMED